MQDSKEEKQLKNSYGEGDTPIGTPILAEESQLKNANGEGDKPIDTPIGTPILAEESQLKNANGEGDKPIDTPILAEKSGEKNLKDSKNVTPQNKSQFDEDINRIYESVYQEENKPKNSQKLFDRTIKSICIIH